MQKRLTPWVAGVSHGSLFGELRGVLDFNGEQNFYIRPPSGPEQVECIFPESLREKAAKNLFQVVRVHGRLHYNGCSPFPRLIEAISVEEVAPPTEHFSAINGLFAGASGGSAYDG